MNSILRATPHSSAAGRNPVRSLLIGVFAMPERAVDLLVVWEKRLKQRNALDTMDARLLDDMGMSPEDAVREAAKPFWRA